MAVKPAHRLKKRYILFDLKGDFSEEEVSRSIYLHSLAFFGEYGLSRRTVKLIEFEVGRGIILCDRDSANEVLGMLALIAGIGDKPARPIARRTGGTLASLQRKDKVKSTS
ncbi:MAG: Rpp14/Pop5 family protein [Candidatus Micrarchaeia archaeon]